MGAEFKIERGKNGFKDGEIAYKIDICQKGEKIYTIELICDCGIDTQGNRDYRFDCYKIKFDNLLIDFVNRNSCKDEVDLLNKTITLCNRCIDEKISRFEKMRADMYRNKRVLLDGFDNFLRSEYTK